MAKTAAPAVTPPQLVKAKVEGLRIVSPLKEAASELTVDDEDEYTHADALLARVQSAIREWDDKMETVLAPLRQAKQAADTIKREVTKPLTELEVSIKDLMTDFKRKEAVRIANENRRIETKVEKLTDEILDVATRETTARTQQLRDRLAKKREELETKAGDVAAEAPQAVVAAHSKTRTVKKWRIVDKGKAIKALNPGYSHLITFDTVAINKLTTQPEGWDVVAGWDGFEVYDDVVIVGR